MPVLTKALLSIAVLAAAAPSLRAQQQQPPAIQQASAVQTDLAKGPINAPAPGGASEGAEPAGKLVLLFPSGTDTLTAENQALLDKASRLYRDGHPIIMVVSGSTDSVGNPTNNLLLSQRRANMVARGLLARGIPADRTQILAKGETNPAVEAPRGTPVAQNRRVEISWR